MIKCLELESPDSCMSRAKWDEFVFVLLARDIAAPVAIRAWVNARLSSGKNKISDAQIQEALKTAEYMELQCKTITKE